MAGDDQGRTDGGRSVQFAWLCSHEAYQPEDLVEQAVRAEAAGFDAVLGSDHFHPWVDDVSAAGFVWSWLGAVATRTTRVALGTAVTCPLFHYHPGLVAQAAATVDRLSGGRFLLGVGTGEALNETPLGWDFPPYAERQARMGEALDIIEALLAGEKLDHDGTYYTTRTARLYSPPTHRVPVLVAAGGPKSARFAGQHADGLITSVKDPAATVAKIIEPFRTAAADRGLTDPPILATRWAVLGVDDDEAWQALGAMRGLRAPGRLEVTDPAVLRQRADEMDRSEVLGSYTVVPHVWDLIDVYRPLVELGPAMVSIQVATTDPLAAIDAIGADVLPRLRELAAPAG